jgi:hypothetical protein
MKEARPAQKYCRKLVLPYSEYQAYIKMSNTDPHRMKPTSCNHVSESGVDLELPVHRQKLWRAPPNPNDAKPIALLPQAGGFAQYCHAAHVSELKWEENIKYFQQIFWGVCIHVASTLIFVMFW